MKTKYLFLFLLVTAIANPAQSQYRKRLKEYSAGVALGADLTDIRLSADCYNIYSHQWTPHPILGAFFQYRSEDGYSFRPELFYFGRGGGLTCQDVSYRLLAHCLDLRFGMRIDYVVPRSLFTFYGVVTPELTFTMGGDVEYTSKNTGALAMPISRSNMGVVDLGVFAGLGLEFPVFFDLKAIYLSCEAGYHLNILNSFTSREASGDIDILNIINLPPLAQGSRMSGGFELTVRIGIPFGDDIRIKR